MAERNNSKQQARRLEQRAENSHFELKGQSKGNKVSVSTVSYSDQPRQQYETSPFTVHMKNTYQLGPTKYFPVATVNRILKDVLTAYLQEAKYDPEFCKQMTKTISEVIKAQVKELMIPRYKLIVIVYIGQRDCQSILIASRCLWDPKSDTVSSYTFTNSTLFAVANVYGVYFE
ncbi:tctex1 domain-containing protein 1 isoform X2 [Cricetulus griseus]|uniref:Tctex1 domain-containing protein 1 isoform X2 n=1 Tax=Cricetulus griseus TaxID=10029 RepID=A0A9J7FFZ7_CRIGR|nr:tctex1 domain-containing protein 1 isoform X2 [Cricetulus griseus]XP_027258067.2 tctex1 domain-containing protein 1 isoform X2 [Cricetulus griseus]